MHKIIATNQLSDVTQLSIGQKLRIPTSMVIANQEQDISASKASSSIKAKDIIHHVKSGETLWEISRKYQVSVQSIAQSNRIKENGLIKEGQRLLIPNVKDPSRFSCSFSWPLRGNITSKYGLRYLNGRKDYHSGIDIDGSTGTPIRSSENGKVSFSGYINGYGNVVIINHNSGYSTVYAHNSCNLVKEGQSVLSGDIIAKMGCTGNATGSHLHFEIRKDGKPVNPLSYLN